MDKRTLKNIDLLFVLFTCLLLMASLVILSTASYNVITLDPYHYVKTQAMWIVIGLGVVIFLAVIDYEKWRVYRWWIYGFNIVLLFAVLLWGENINGATRWIQTPFGFNIQPSEFAKVFIIIILADFLAERKGRLNTIKDFIPPFLLILPPVLLVFKQPDLGTSLVFVAIFLGMMFVAGANAKKLGGLLLGAALIVGAVLWLHLSPNVPGWLQWAQSIPMPLEGYQLKRLTIFMNPEADMSGDGYHVIQSIWAIGSGGLWGKGYREGTQGQLDFLPEHHTDFIFSVVGEEFGFIGTITILFLYFIFLLRCLSIAMKARDTFGLLLVTGVVAMFIFHILVNIGMTSGIMPVVGIPLPLISAGGSAMLTNMAAVGLVLSVNLRRQRLMF